MPAVKAKKKTKAGARKAPASVVVRKAAPVKVAKKAAIPIPPVAPPVVRPDRARPRDLRDMNRFELEEYATELGLMKRALLLGDDRLRQNIQAFIDHTRE